MPVRQHELKCIDYHELTKELEIIHAGTVEPFGVARAEPVL